MKSIPTLLMSSAVVLQLPLNLPALATQVQRLSVEELGVAAARVVRGKVASTRSYWNPEHTKIYTEVVLAPDETYRGNDTGIVRVLQLGGSVDGVRVTVHGTLGWTSDEEVLLFLEPYPNDRFVVSGHSQGKFDIVRDASSSEAVVTRLPLEDLELMGPDGAKILPAEFERIPLTLCIHRALGNVPGRQEN